MAAVLRRQDTIRLCNQLCAAGLCGSRGVVGGASLPSVLKSATGQAVGAISANAPHLMTSASEVASALPGALEAVGQGRLGTFKPGPGLKAALEFNHVPIDPSKVGEVLTTVTQNGLGSSVQNHLESVNDVFSALGLPVWIVRSTTTDAQASVRVVQPQAPRDQSEPEQSELTPRQFIRFMQEARKSGSVGVGLERYVDRMIEDGRLRHVVLVPNSFEPKLYVDVARLMVFIWHRCIGTLNSASFWGHQLHVETSPAKTIFYKGRRGRTNVGEAQIGLIVDKMLENKAVNMLAVPDFFEKRMYVNCITLIFQLLDDMMMGDGEEVTCMGHALRFSLEKQPLDVLIQMLHDNPVSYCKIDEGVIDDLADELLADSDVNLQWMPDIIERQIYKSVMRLMIRVMEDMMCRVKVKMLGRDVDVRILGAEDVKAQASQAEKPEDVLYYGEDDPLKTISSTELEERLKDIDDQRRILEAIKELGGADFDLTAERPMIQRKTHAASAKDASMTGDKEPEEKQEEEVHEFQRLAHTLKLGRSLSVKMEVEADIEVPYTMIAELETYPDWMPWCTSGKVVGQRKEGSDAGESVYEGAVGFGFDTGSFLGTLGDTVSYRITQNPPSQGSGTETESDEPNSGRVVADAVDGFAYGERLVYDWRFKELRTGVTKVELDMLFQARSVIYMPFWDSMQNMIIGKMLVSFKSRAEVLQKQRQAQPPPSKNE